MNWKKYEKPKVSYVYDEFKPNNYSESKGNERYSTGADLYFMHWFGPSHRKLLKSAKKRKTKIAQSPAKRIHGTLKDHDSTIAEHKVAESTPECPNCSGTSQHTQATGSTRVKTTRDGETATTSLIIEKQ